jgi:hypothetical protein
MDDSFGVDLPPVEYSATVDMCQDTIAELESRVRELEAELAVADKGLLRASDPKSGWSGINNECKLWQERAEQAEAERDRLKAENYGLHCNCGNSEFKCLVCESHVNTFSTTALIKKLYAREEQLRARLTALVQEHQTYQTKQGVK